VGSIYSLSLGTDNFHLSVIEERWKLALSAVLNSASALHVILYRIVRPAIVFQRLWPVLGSVAHLLWKSSVLGRTTGHLPDRVRMLDSAPLKYLCDWCMRSREDW